MPQNCLTEDQMGSPDAYILNNISYNMAHMIKGALELLLFWPKDCQKCLTYTKMCYISEIYKAIFFSYYKKSKKKYFDPKKLCYLYKIACPYVLSLT